MTPAFSWPPYSKENDSPLMLLRFLMWKSALIGIGERWGMANDGEWRTGQYLVEGVKAIKCFHPRMLASLMAGVNTN